MVAAAWTTSWLELTSTGGDRCIRTAIRMSQIRIITQAPKNSAGFTAELVADES